MKVLVIDDSALMRKYLRDILGNVSGMVIETARDGADGLEKIQQFDPDVITLDINMPVMDGLTCLSHIMTDFPRPVIMVSSLTEQGALVTFEALALGAVDYVFKPGGTVSLNIKSHSAEIISKVRAAGGAKLRCATRHLTPNKPETGRRRTHQDAAASCYQSDDGVVVIGVSTGGPTTLEIILTQLPADFPLPILVAQHMPAKFTRVFVERLNKHCQLDIVEVDQPTEIKPGKVLVARGDADLRVSRRGARLLALSVPAGSDQLWKPSVDNLVRSVRDVFPAASTIGVELTGMGNDGAAAMAELHRDGGLTIAESEETAVVYGMPRELVALGGATVVLPNHDIAAQLGQWAETLQSKCATL